VVSIQLSAGDGRIDGIYWRLSHGCHMWSSDDRESTSTYDITHRLKITPQHVPSKNLVLYLEII